MIALGLFLFPVFILYEARYPSKPVVPVKWFKRAPIMGACAIGFLDFVSFYLQYTYLYPYVLNIATLKWAQQRDRRIIALSRRERKLKNAQ
jgi:predicted MFS family arabinose efflux permease